MSVKSLVRRAVLQAFRALGDYVDDGEIVVRTAAAEFDWDSVQPAVSQETVPCQAVLVDEKMKHSRDATKQRWAIIKTERSVELMSILKIGGRSYRCGAPIESYRFVTLLEVYEVQ